ncbi:hypothetical protein BJ165DRAFT_1535701 [Panaeolus papilionaceus]|nr:hypothetical protein BJ165DRAFT_1535701 [Panaeolus papilionaceus]
MKAISSLCFVLVAVVSSLAAPVLDANIHVRANIGEASDIVISPLADAGLNSVQVFFHRGKWFSFNRILLIHLAASRAANAAQSSKWWRIVTKVYRWSTRVSETLYKSTTPLKPIGFLANYLWVIGYHRVIGYGADLPGTQVESQPKLSVMGGYRLS